MLDAQFLTKVKYQCGKTRWQFPPTDKPGFILRVDIESPHEGHKPIRRRKAIDPPKTLFGGMLDDRDTGRPILHDYPQPEPDLAAGDPLVVCSNLRYCIVQCSFAYPISHSTMTPATSSTIPPTTTSARQRSSAARTANP